MNNEILLSLTSMLPTLIGICSGILVGYTIGIPNRGISKTKKNKKLNKRFAKKNRMK